MSASSGGISSNTEFLLTNAKEWYTILLAYIATPRLSYQSIVDIDFLQNFVEICVRKMR